MDFTEELTAFQGVIISADNMHTFSKLNGRRGNEEKLLAILGKVYKFLSDKNYVDGKGVTDEGKLQMRIYCFYLILNSDLPILEDLVDMPGIENVVWTLPTINKCLICEMVWGLNMETYIEEVLIYCHPALSLQVLIQFTNYIKYSSPNSCSNHLYILVSSCYRLICRMHFYDYDNSFISTVLSDIFDNVLIILNYYVTPPNADKLNTLSEDENYKYKGENIYSLLSLTHDCLGFFLSSCKFKPEGFDEMYQTTIKSDNLKATLIAFKMYESEDNLLLEYLCKINTALLDKCKILVMDTSVEIFCAWSEFMENGKSMQKTIGEMCYLLHTRLGHIPSLLEHPLVNMLPQLSCKPTDINNIINMSDLDTMLENANKKTDEQILWLQAILKREDLFESEPSFECLLNNIDTFNEDDSEKAYKILCDLYDDRGSSYEEILKLLIIKFFSKISNTRKTELLGEHFCKRFFHDNLELDEFQSMNTELFNRFTTSSETDLSQIYTVFMQSPRKVYKKIVNSAIDNSKQCDLMVRIMKVLEPFATHFYRCDVDPAIIKAVEHAQKKKLQSDLQINNFVQFISELKKVNVFTGARVLLLIIMPSLHKALLNRDITVIHVQVKLLKTAYDLSELLEYRAPLLAMIAQILDTVRWTFSTFTGNAPTILEDSLQLQMLFFNTYELQIPDNESKWLKSKLTKLQPLNIYYYKKIWNPPGSNFLEIITGQKNLSANRLAILLAKVLCSSTSREWCVVWDCLKNDGDILGLEIVYNALIFMIKAMESERNNNTWSCLLYCYRNFMLIIKNNFFSEPLLDSHVENVVDKLIKIINNQKESDVEEVGNIILPLLSYIIEDRKTDYNIDLSCIGNKIKHPHFAGMVNQLFVNTME